MNILGLVFPASFLRHTDPPQSLERNDSRTKFSIADGVPRSMENTKESSQGIISQKDQMHGSSEKSSDVPDELPGHSSSIGGSSHMVTTSSDGNEPVKRKSKKKKKMKRKSEKIRVKNENVSEVGDMDSLNIPSTQSPRKIPLRTGQMKEVIGKSVHDVDGAKLNSERSKSRLGPEVSRRILRGSDTECLAGISDFSLDIAVLVDQGSGYRKVDKTLYTNLSENQHKNAKADRKCAVISSVMECKPGLEDPRVWKTKSVTKSLGLNNSNGAGTIEPMEGNCRSTESSEETPNLDISGRAIFSVRHSEAIVQDNDHKTGDSIRAPFSTPPVIDTAACTGKVQNSLGTKKAYNNDIHEEIRSINQYTGVTSDLATVPVQNYLGAKGAENTSNQEIKSSNQCYPSSDAPVVAPIKISDRGVGHAHVSISQSSMPSHKNDRNKFGKENKQFVWQRTGRNTGTLQTHTTNKSGHIHQSTNAALADKSVGDGLLPLSHVANSSKNGFQQKQEYLGICCPKILHNHTLVEASEWEGQERFHTRVDQYELRSREDSFQGKKFSARLKSKPNHPFKPEKNNDWKMELWVSKANLCKPGTRSNFSRKPSEFPRTAFPNRSNFSGQRSRYCTDDHNDKLDHFEANQVGSSPCFSVCSSHIQLRDSQTQSLGEQGGLMDSEPHGRAETAFSEGVNDKASHASLVYAAKSFVCCNIGRPFDNSVESISRSSKMWVPVSKKGPSMLRSNHNIDGSNIIKEEHHQETRTVACDGTASVVDVISNGCEYNGLTNGGQAECLGEVGKCDNIPASDHNFPIYIGSELAERALDASYRLQIACEDTQLATGSHIAEFEKLLSAASPVISPISRSHFEDVVNGPMESSFSESQKSSILLKDIWCWYERPGNYGLEVKAEDCQNSEGGLDTSISFCAHFIPLLSAIQLFGHSHCLSSSSQSNSGIDMVEKRNNEQCLPAASCPDVQCTSCLDSVSKKHRRPCVLPTTDGCGSFTMVSSLCSDDAHVIFEYFEYEPPQQRKPLFAKMKELFEVGASNPLGFGDPSKLGCMNLLELHPASWFSVAWYPIYRIPEGHLRASFLTYHSLGHLSRRNIKPISVEQNSFHVVLPVLGMQSYNAQGECWFYPKKSVEPLLKDGKRVNISALLKERLRNLEEAAALYARGHVRCRHSPGPNNQPDYEFFLSRRQRLLPLSSSLQFF